MRLTDTIKRFGVTWLLVTVVLSLPQAYASTNYKTLFAFTAGNGDGKEPRAGVILDQAGNLYGTTSTGGTHGAGTVFKLTPNSNGTWTESVLYNFKGVNDGATPLGTLIFDQAGNLWGTTAGGGGSSNGGTAFKLTPNGKSWNESVVFSFSAGSGSTPYAGLVFDASGNLYGTTWGGRCPRQRYRLPVDASWNRNGVVQLLLDQ
jgi:uncharacterized repeat protein (TIGR03803 family)